MTTLHRLLIVPLALCCLALAVSCNSAPSPTPAAPPSTVARPLTASASADAAAAPTTTLTPTALTALPSVPVTGPTTVATSSATGTARAAGAQAPEKVASAIALGAALSQRGGNQAAATTIDPCLLLPRAAAEAGAQTVLAELRHYSDATGPACEYSSDSSEVSVTITALAGGGRRAYDDSSSGYGQGRTAIAGVGDQAFVIKGLGVIYVLKGDTLLTLQLVSLKLGGDETAAALTTMAKVMLSHL